MIARIKPVARLALIFTAVNFALADVALDDTCRNIADGGLKAMWSGSGQLGPTNRARIRAFALTQLSEAQNAQNVFYPFSGSDIFYAHIFFPNVHNLTLVALERAGVAPDASHGALVATGFRTMNGSSYQVTDELKVDLANIGVAPMICGALAVMGFSVKSMRLSRYSVSFVYGRDGETDRRLTYISTDLSNRQLSGAVASAVAGPWWHRVPLDATLLKATQYYTHSSAFSRLNRLVLRSKYIVQSDSGIPYKNLTASNHWDLHFYGTYTGVTERKDFARFDQPDLIQAFAEAPAHVAIPFVFDYGRPANLIFAIRR